MTTSPFFAMSLPTSPRLRFQSPASIVLTGTRGSGKSTLAIIASSAMKRRVIDCEKIFQQTMRVSSGAYMKAHGTAECHRAQAAILQDILRGHGQRNIIVCWWAGREVLGLLQDFAAYNPVIQILRDAEAIQDHLKLETLERAQYVVAASTALFRTCSNLEFYNISERLQRIDGMWDPESIDSEHRPAPYLTLKRAERHFLKFLSLVMPPGSIPFIESAFPLAAIPVEDRQFTYAMSVRLSTLLQNGFDLDIENLETGADAIEVVIDDLDVLYGGPRRPAPGTLLSEDRATTITRLFGTLRRDTVIPLIYHVFLPCLSIEFDKTPWHDLYLSYLSHGLKLSCEYLTIDLRLPTYDITLIAQKRLNSKLIGHFILPLSAPPSPSTTWMDPLWLTHYHRAQSLGCDLVRLIKPTATVQDNFDINHLKAAITLSLHTPLIAFNSGNRGRHSAIMNQTLTSVGVHPTPSYVPDTPHSSIAQLTAQQATAALYASFLFDPMKLYVFGAKVGYSLSPAMHNRAFVALGIPHYYSPYSTPTLRGIKELIDDPHFAGASVGLPFKVEIIALTHSLSRHAQAIGAVNTLIPVRQLNPDGSIPSDTLLISSRNRAGPVRALYGDNTDWIGIRACLRRGLSPANAVLPSTSGVVVGAGGMARAAVYAMLQLGVKNIVVHNRTLANAQRMVSHFQDVLARGDLPQLTMSPTDPSPETPTRFHILPTLDAPWPPTFRKPTMIIVCIPIHAIGNVPAPHLEAPASWLSSPTGGVVVDLGYKRLDTAILRQARALAGQGWLTMDGLDLLPEQGFAQFELFTGRRAPRRAMRRFALEAWSEEGSEGAGDEVRERFADIGEQEP